MSTPKCRWGILSTAGIAKKNWRAIRMSGNGVVRAVASRNLESANAFIDACQTEVPFEDRPQSVEGYQALLNRDDIDAVYIPLPTGLRKEWILAAARAGKHILAEKPAALTSEDLREILDECEKHQVQYMDGVMFMHSQRLPKLRQVLDDGRSVGNIRRIATQFSFCSDQEFRSNNIRSNSDAEPHGCLGDLGWYCIRMILWTMQWQMPHQVSGRILQTLQGKNSPRPVPGEFSGELFFDNQVSASFYCSFLTHHQQWVHISGDKGYALVQDYVLPYHAPEVSFEVSNNEFLIDGCDFHMEKHTRVEAVYEYSSGRKPSQEVNLFHHFNDLFLTKKRDLSWAKMTLDTQRVLDAVWQSAQQGSTLLKVS
ncbi:MAG: Gfo/Idh/MocA family oxidoreductase [Pirellulales bacterium]